jgi:DNA-binding transcriptional LysR family regulator
MEIKHLQYFMEVTRTGSFTRAADKLYITQPAISRVIKSLEDELEMPLFIRSRKQLALTEAGRVLYEHAAVFEAQFQQLKTELDNLVTLKKGHIRIGLPSIVNSFFFSRLIASFHQEYPKITFELIEDGSKRIEEKVLNNLLDFGVVVLREKHDLFDYYTFVRDELKLVVPSSHSLAHKQEAALEELKEEDFIMFNQDFALRDRFVAACDKAGFTPKIISETSQLDFIEEMVASGLGITLLPESTYTELTMDVQAISLTRPSIDWNLAMIWKKEERPSQVVKEFIRFAKEKLLHDDGEGRK